MKLGDLVKIDIEPFKNDYGIIIGIDKSFTLFPNNRIFYEVFTVDGKKITVMYEHLIGSEDFYFSV